MSGKPKCVLISDVHYSLNTLEVADAALNGAIDRAQLENVPLIIAGDIHDTKAQLRGECVNRMIQTFKSAKCPIYLIIGNHDLINEKGVEHALEFLAPYVTDIIAPYPSYNNSIFTYEPKTGLYLIPYQSSSDAMLKILASIPKGATLVMHQGVMGADMGHYVQDKTSLPPEAFADYRVISGHYHKTQSIKCGRPRRGGVGLFSYIGNPYTLGFGEAEHPTKGYGVLYDNGILELEPLNLRRHIVLSATLPDVSPLYGRIMPGDLVWVKIYGPKSEVEKVKKENISKILGRADFKLDKIASNLDNKKEQIKVAKMTEAEILDTLIDVMEETKEQKTTLKTLWRNIL